jgi:hypothetical protein
VKNANSPLSFVIFANQSLPSCVISHTFYNLTRVLCPNPVKSLLSLFIFN